MSNLGELYLVATPIGNLDDLTFRAQKVLETVDIVFCEDTRRFQNLVKGKNINLQAKVFSFFKEKEAKATAQALDFLKKGLKIALVSDAGTPLIADPGLNLVQATQKLGVKIIPVPGPTAFVLSLIVSGMFLNPNMTIGYVPKKGGKRIKVFEECKQIAQISSCKTFSFYESPHRLLKTLKAFLKVYGNIPLFLGLELTKINETHQLQLVEDLIQLYEKKKPKGEITGVFSLKNETKS